MSALVMGKVFYLDIPVGMKMTLLALADHAHDDGKGAYPTTQRLVVKTGQSRATVFKWLLEAKTGGIISPSGWRRSGAVEYHFNMTVLDAAEKARRGVEPVQNPEVRNPDPVPVPRRGGSGIQTGGVPVPGPITIIEPSDNHPPENDGSPKLPEERLARAWFALEGRKVTRSVLKKAIPIIRDFFSQWPSARSDEEWVPFLPWARENGVKMLGGLAVWWPQYIEAKPTATQTASKAWIAAITDCDSCLLSGFRADIPEPTRCTHPQVEGGPFDPPSLEVSI